MSTSVDPTITLTEEDGWWVAKDTETGVASQGKTRTEALDNLDEAVALHKGELGEPVEDEAVFLQDIGIDPDEIDGDRELPEFMQ